jgi:predicted glycoside hydrolase/deacetylase ChbG (UPF0249 family)
VAPDVNQGTDRIVIVNADDLGRSEPITDGIIRAHDEGIVTSASLMVRWPDAERAARLARDRPELSLGLHLDFAEYAFEDGEWRPLYEVVATDDAEALDREARAQLARFRELGGCDPTHLDSHQHVHMDEPVREVARRLAGELGVPLRRVDPRVGYDGSFYGRELDGARSHAHISIENLLRLLRELPRGTTELACHPGKSGGGDPAYDEERELELNALVDPRVREVLEAEGIELRSFADVNGPAVS